MTEWENLYFNASNFHDLPRPLFCFVLVRIFVRLLI